MKKIVYTLLLMAASFCTQAQWITDSVLVDSHYRLFRFYEPQQKDIALIFVLHGSGGNARQMMGLAANLESYVRQEQGLLVYPEGYKHYWNECRRAATSAANLENIDEQAFFIKMIAYFKDRFQVNERKVFAIGFSGGGHMAYKLALTMPERIKGIAAIVANLPATDNMDCDEQKKPVAVMIVNGTADPTNPYNGGDMSVGSVQLGKVRSTEETFKYWAAVDGYKGKPKHKAVTDKNTTDNITIDKYSYTSDNKPDVILYKINNGVHQAPTDIDALVEAWKFFKVQMAK